MQRTASKIVDLMNRVAARDQQAFAELYGATSAKLYGIILRILRRRDIADEILQETYVTIWRRAADFDATRASPITWMATIARNRALDVVRKVSHVPIDEAPEALNVRDPARPADELVEMSEEYRRLDRCLDGIAAERRDIVRLAYFDGLSREELAKRYGRPVATIKTWLHRSLKQLKDCLTS